MVAVVYYVNAAHVAGGALVVLGITLYALWIPLKWLWQSWKRACDWCVMHGARGMRIWLRYMLPCCVVIFAVCVFILTRPGVLPILKDAEPCVLPPDSADAVMYEALTAPTFSSVMLLYYKAVAITALQTVLSRPLSPFKDLQKCPSFAQAFLEK